jgi:transposase
LSSDQLQQLAELLLAGPQTYGFEGELWTSKLVKWLIEFKFGVKLHRAHVSRLLREQLNWNAQKPVEKASQRDEQAIAKFKEQCWPHLKRRLKTRSAALSG